MRRAFAAGLGATLGAAAGAAGIALAYVAAMLLDDAINGEARAARMRYWTALSYGDKAATDERRRELDDAEKRRRWWQW